MNLRARSLAHADASRLAKEEENAAQAQQTASERNVGSSPSSTVTSEQSDLYVAIVEARRGRGGGSSSRGVLGGVLSWALSHETQFG